MLSHKIAFVASLLFCFSFVIFSPAEAQFRGAPPTKKTPPKPKPTPPKPKPTPPKPKPSPGHNHGGGVRCNKCGQTYSPRVGHTCPADVGKNLGELIGHIIDSIPDMETCRNCGAQYPFGQHHQCPPPRPQVVRCGNCGAHYYQGQHHQCPPPRPQELEGNALPPIAPPVVPPKIQSVQKSNFTSLKLTNLNQQNIVAIQDELLSPLKDAQMNNIENAMPSDKKITDKIDSIETQPPLTVQEKKKLFQAIKNGDNAAVKSLFKNKVAEDKDKATLMTLADVNNLVNKYNNGDLVKPSEMKSLMKGLKYGDSSLLGNLVSQVQTFGTLNKIGKILDTTLTILASGGTLTVGVLPNGIVPIITFPGLPFGVIFPLGNGLYGMGTGGLGDTDIFQGYIPQPPIYEDDAINGQAMGNGTNIVLHNDNSEAVQYYFPGETTAHTLSGNSWTNWHLPDGHRMGIPGKNNDWMLYRIENGAYTIAKNPEGGYKLQKPKTSITLKSPGNPIPFTFYTGDTKYVIEPGGSITLISNNQENGVFEIRFARSPDKTDIASYTVGGAMTFNVGRDQADGKWSLFPEGAAPITPPAPVQDASAVINPEISYDETPIDASNISGLPVLPTYD